MKKGTGTGKKDEDGAVVPSEKAFGRVALMAMRVSQFWEDLGASAAPDKLPASAAWEMLSQAEDDIRKAVAGVVDSVQERLDAYRKARRARHPAADYVMSRLRADANAIEARVEARFEELCEGCGGEILLMQCAARDAAEFGKAAVDALANGHWGTAATCLRRAAAIEKECRGGTQWQAVVDALEAEAARAGVDVRPTKKLAENARGAVDAVLERIKLLMDDSDKEAERGVLPTEPPPGPFLPAPAATQAPALAAAPAGPEDRAAGIVKQVCSATGNPRPKGLPELPMPDVIRESALARPPKKGSRAAVADGLPDCLANPSMKPVLRQLVQHGAHMVAEPDGYLDCLVAVAVPYSAEPMVAHVSSGIRNGSIRDIKSSAAVSVRAQGAVVMAPFAEMHGADQTACFNELLCRAIWHNAVVAAGGGTGAAAAIVETVIVEKTVDKTPSVAPEAATSAVGGVRPRQVCRKCFKPGHNALTCGRPASAPPVSGRRTCSNCQERGHDIRVCPNPAKPKAGADAVPSAPPKPPKAAPPPKAAAKAMPDPGDPDPYAERRLLLLRYLGVATPMEDIYRWAAVNKIAARDLATMLASLAREDMIKKTDGKWRRIVELPRPAKPAPAITAGPRAAPVAAPAPPAKAAVQSKAKPEIDENEEDDDDEDDDDDDVSPASDEIWRKRLEPVLAQMPASIGSLSAWAAANGMTRGKLLDTLAWASLNGLAVSKDKIWSATERAGQAEAESAG